MTTPNPQDRTDPRPDDAGKRAADPAPDRRRATPPGSKTSATDDQPSGIDLETESAAGEEDPGAGLDAPDVQR